MAVGDDDGAHRPLLRKILHRTAVVAAQRPYIVLTVCVTLAVAAGIYSWLGLTMKNSRADLIDPRTDYQRRWIHYTEAFGGSSDLVVLVEADRPDTIRQVLEDLGQRVEQQSELFRNVLYKIDTSRLRSKGLQYLSPEQLRQLQSRMLRFGGVIRRHGDPLELSAQLAGMNEQLTGTVAETENVAVLANDASLQQIAAIASSLADFAQPPHEYHSPWRQMVPPEFEQMAGDAVQYTLNEHQTMGFLLAQPVSGQKGKGLSKPIAQMRSLIADTQANWPQARLSLTGIPVLEADEMASSQRSMMWASGLSLVGVALLLILGFRGKRHPFMALVMLLIGTLWAFGVTTLTIGHLNILSISFAAMLFGLGIDFAIVYLTRYLELRSEGQLLFRALYETAEEVGPSILTAAITTAAAFYVAMLTDFTGVAELGFIAGTGILLCALAAFLVLPALLSVADRLSRSGHLPELFDGHLIRRGVQGYPYATIGIAVVLLAATGWLSFGVKYDYNLLNMQAEGTPSVEAQKRLVAQDGSILFAVSLAHSAEETRDKHQEFAQLPMVSKVDDLAAMLPAHSGPEQERRIRSIRLFLNQMPAELPTATPVDPQPVRQQLEESFRLLENVPAANARATRTAINSLLTTLDDLSPEAQRELLQHWQQRSSRDLYFQVQDLRNATNLEPVTIADLPQALVSRYLSPHGDWLLKIYPSEPIWDIEPLTRFVEQVRDVDSEATGTPLQTYEASRAIKHSYENSGWYALIAVVILLLLDFHSVRDSLIALLSPAAGVVLTLGCLVLLKVDLNPANLILLPLILGIGVDGGVHVVHDYRTQTGPYRISASTINAMFLTAGTSIIGFGSLMIAQHRGLYSLGLVLSVGIASCLLVSLGLLPAILTLISRRHEAKVESLASGAA